MMKVSLVCFTRMGFETMKKIAGTGGAGGNEEKWDTSLWVAGRYALRLAKEDAGLPYQAIAEGGLSAWTGAEFQRSDALIFVGACGIAVRAIAPFVQDKFHDPAVLCVDEAGTFVIPLLSGHVGGANRLAEFVAGGIGAVPVVTTATDVRSGCLCKGSRACDHRPGACKKDLGGYSCGGTGWRVLGFRLFRMEKNTGRTVSRPAL